MLQTNGLDIVAPLQRSIVAHQELWHEEQRDAGGALRRAGQAGEHQVHDVVGEIVLAIGDVDFRASDPLGPVAGGLGLGAEGADVGARIGLRQIHRRG
ncbi:MAG: hypothetical protein AAF909_12655, partial [Pseudomonadota bacterium]